MRPKKSSPLPKSSASNRRSGGLTLQTPVNRKRKTPAWLRGRRPEMQPWKRGRIRPSNCHDLAEKA